MPIRNEILKIPLCDKESKFYEPREWGSGPETGCIRFGNDACGVYFTNEDAMHYGVLLGEFLALHDPIKVRFLELVDLMQRLTACDEAFIRTRTRASLDDKSK